MNILYGKLPSAKKVVLYGPEGIGKSTFASKFPDPIFIDTEGSTKEMEVKRFDAPTKWDELIEEADYVRRNPRLCKTLIIDTADWAEMLCIKHICEKGNVNGIEDFGYGKGYTYLAENFKKLLDILDKIIVLGINVVFTAHAKMRKFEQPDEMGAYDRWEMKLSRQVAPMLKEWADMLLFANYKTYVIEDSKTKSKKASGGKRVMYTSHHPCWDAKNRYGLEDCLPFDYSEIAKIIGEEQKAITSKPQRKNQPKEEVKEEPKKEKLSETKTKLLELLKESNMPFKRLEYAIYLKGFHFLGAGINQYTDDFIQDSLIDKWDKFCKYANKFSQEEIDDAYKQIEDTEMPFNNKEDNNNE